MSKYFNQRISKVILFSFAILVLLSCLSVGTWMAMEENAPAQASASQQKTSQGLEFTSNGDGTCYVSGIGSCQDTDLVIPSVSPDGDRVTMIGDHAFEENQEIKSVVISDGVTVIGEFAFAWCIALENVILPESVDEIWNEAFFWCEKLSSITLPKKMTELGYSVFYGCSNLKSITIPEGITKLKSRMFMEAGLESVVLPNSLTEIWMEAFLECPLKIIRFPNGLKKIETWAFQGCHWLSDILIPESVTEIEEEVFEGCTLVRITILNPECKIAEGAIEPSTTISGHKGSTAEAYALENGNPFLGTDPYDEVGLHYTSNGDGTCYVSSGGYYYDENIVIPQYSPAGDRVTAIGPEAFSWCIYLRSVKIPDGVTKIGNSAFLMCRILEKITIPDSVTEIGDGVFSGCSSLTDITLPPNLSKTGRNLFSGCKSLTNITFAKGTTTIGSYMYADCTGLTNITIPEGVTVIGNGAFSGCTNLTSVTLPESLTKIGESVFWRCSNLATIKIPKAVQSIGDHAFYECKNLISINLPKNLTKIGSSTFYFCERLQSITIPDGVELIDDHAFQYCASLKEITIPDGVTSIGMNAFYGCRKLEKITVPDSVSEIGESAFSGTVFYSDSDNWENGVLYLSNCLIEVSDTFEGSCVIKEGTRHIRSRAFQGNTKLTSVTFPNSIRSIGDSAFHGCTNLIDIVLPDGGVEIGFYAFQGCTALKKIEIPKGVKTICYGAFLDCTALSDISLPDSELNLGLYAFANTAFYNDEENWENDVLYLGNYLIQARPSLPGSYTIKSGTKFICNGAFVDCTKLISVTFPYGVVSISEDAFRNCTGLKNVVYLDSVTKIGESAFSGCKSLETMVFSNSVTKIERYVFDDCSSLSSITVLNPICSLLEEAVPSNVVIYGYVHSGAQSYAKANGNPFVELPSIEEDDIIIEEDKVVIESESEEDNQSIYISSDIVSDWAGKEITVNGSVGTITFDATASDKLASSGDVVLGVSNVTSEKDQANGIVSISITLKSNGESILPADQAGMNGKITVSVPYLPGFTMETLQVTYIGEDGEREDITITDYNAETGVITFVTSHLSLYEISEKREISEDTGENEIPSDGNAQDDLDGDATTQDNKIVSEGKFKTVIIVAVVVLVFILGGVWLVKKNKRIK